MNHMVILDYQSHIYLTVNIVSFVVVKSGLHHPSKQPSPVVPSCLTEVPYLSCVVVFVLIFKQSSLIFWLFKFHFMIFPMYYSSALTFLL